MAALTKEQLLERRKGIGGSDAAKIVRGDWYDLWLDKTGRVEPKMIMSEWDSALRHCTEPLQLEWYTKKTGNKVVGAGEVMVCKSYPFLRCTLDGFDAADSKVIQCKHLSEFTKDPPAFINDHYLAQVQHEMLCLDVSSSVFSVIVGMKEPVLIPIEADEFWQMDYVGKAEEFWSYVTRDVPPPGASAMAAPPKPKEEMRVVDMTGNNKWAASAADWLENRKAAKKFDTATEDLKKLVEADVREARGYGVVASKNKKGAISIKKDDD